MNISKKHILILAIILLAAILAIVLIAVTNKKTSSDLKDNTIKALADAQSGERPVVAINKEGFERLHNSLKNTKKSIEGIDKDIQKLKNDDPNWSENAKLKNLQKTKDTLIKQYNYSVVEYNDSSSKISDDSLKNWGLPKELQIIEN